MEVRVTESALKHGATLDSIAWIISTADMIGADWQGGLWWLGNDRDGDALEIIARTLDDNTIMVYHAMPMKWRKR
jgi:hypothetical protein